jgi:hypothetical protein
LVAVVLVELQTMELLVQIHYLVVGKLQQEVDMVLQVLVELV